MAEWVVFRLSALGDVALMTGVLDRAYRLHGHTFTVITREALAELFTQHPAVTEVIPLPRRLSLSDTLCRFREIARRFAGQTLLDWHGTLRSRLLGLLWQGPVRRYNKAGIERRLFLLSRTRFVRSFFFRPLFGRALLCRTVPQRYAATLHEPPPPAQELTPRLYLTPSELDAAKLTLAPLQTTIHNAPFATSAPLLHPLVALHPYATHANKALPKTFWLALAKLLQKREIPFFVVGQTPNQPNQDTQLLFASLTIPDFTNQTSLRETCALLACAAVLVSGDSGPLHLACAVQTPVIALFGPTTRHWGFFPQGPHDQVLELPYACRPCSLHGQGECHRQHLCVRDFAPELVVAAVQKRRWGRKDIMPQSPITPSRED